MSIAIVMPAYNESECIRPVVQGWLPVVDQLGGELIVVNDGSKDSTGQILDEMAIQHPNLRVVHQKNAGHGAAVLRGYSEALSRNHEYVFQTDSDDQFSPKDFWELWKVRTSSPFVMGFRKVRSDAKHRLVITKIMLTLNLVLFGAYLRDANVPFRLMKSGFLRGLLAFFPGDVFAPNIFLSVLASKAGCDLKEIPIQHVERHTGQVSIIRWKLVKVCLRCVKELTAFRFTLASRGREIRSLKSRYV